MDIRLFLKENICFRCYGLFVYIYIYTHTYIYKGYQRELTYRHTDGSYSAFGKSDKEGSIWLTAFVVKSFAQAKPYMFIDEKDLKMSIDWMISKQLDTGCFPQVIFIRY